MASSMRSLGAVMGVLLLAIVVQAQWPFGGGNTGGGGNGGANSGGWNGWDWGAQSQPRAQPTQYNPWGVANGGGPNQNPNSWQNLGWPSSWGFNPQPSPGAGTSKVTVTVTRTSPTGGYVYPTQPPVSTPGQAPPYNPYSPEPTRTWSQPSAWGPPRSPFGPLSTPTGPQTIPTTTVDAPRPNVPFLTYCGNTKYVEDDVSNALTSGCHFKNKTSTVNKSEYPRLFQNTYNFNFGDVQGPLWEFPLISSAAYIGGNAGPDRVIFNDACYLAGEITQTGAGWRGFTECREASY